MKTTALIASLLVAAPALAQTTPAPAPAPAPATGAQKFTVDTPVETIAADPAGKAALESAVPGITAHPMWDSFKSMSLTQLQPMSNGQLTDEMVTKAKTALAGVK